MSDSGEFRLDTLDVAHDLAHPEAPRTVFGLITAALSRRRESGTPPFTVLSCDNLRHNGEVARRAILAFAEARDPALATWIAGNVTFPSCMVDRITPAVLPADVERLNALTGVDDAVPVFAEDFIQWVIEDRFCAGRPALEAVGVQFTNDVGAYERIKLRMLNASHTVLSFPGLLGGYRFVHEAMADERIRGFLRRFLDEDVIPLLKAPPGMALDAYRDSVLDRFSNPAINDQLSRITSDSGSKIPIFLGDTIRASLEGGRTLDRLALTLAGFARYLGSETDGGERFTPQEPHLTEADLALARDADPAAPLRISTLAPLGLDRSPEFTERFTRYRALITERGVLDTIGAI
jgi:mannitol-1-phosphate/altronate dehydrogenase